MRLFKNIMCLLAFALVLFFTTGCDLDDVVVDIIVPGYGGGGSPIIEVYEVYESDPYYNDSYYDDPYYDDHDDFYFEFYTDF